MNETSSDLFAGIQISIWENIKKIFKNCIYIDEVILFGSRAKENYSSGSDIDLVIKGEKLTINDLFLISTKLDELNLPYKIDLLLFNLIHNNTLIEHINKYGKKIV